MNLHVISATHRDIRQMIQNGEFREDLYYRLNGITLHLPLLRDRERQGRLDPHAARRKRTPTRTPIEIAEEAFQRLLDYRGPAISVSCEMPCAPPRHCAAMASFVCRIFRRKFSHTDARSIAPPSRR